MLSLRTKVLDNEQLNANILLLSETHLKRQFQAEGWQTAQTRHDSKGGALVASKLRWFKSIKTLGTGIAWASVSKDFHPVQLISVYLAPQNAKQVKETMGRLLLAVDNVLTNLPRSKFLIAGDFNEHRASMQRELVARGFVGVIPEGLNTHRDGHHLDQIFANFSVDVQQLPEGTVDSDHRSFLVTATIVKDQGDVDLRHLPRQHTKADMRKLANE